MAFEYAISKAINISTEKDALGTKVLVLEFKYVRFLLKLDDPEKFEELVIAITGAGVPKKKVKQEKIDIPKMYKG